MLVKGGGASMSVLSFKTQAALDRAVEALKAPLKDNLYSCVLYGSAVRGDFVPVASDVNLLIVLNESTPEAHAAIVKAVRGKLRIDPFVIGRPGMERSFKSFALKFLSIQRDYKLLYGEDPLTSLNVEKEYEWFLCEQGLRNIRLRLVRGFIVFGEDRRRYTQFLIHWIPTLFIDLSAALRLNGTEIPHDFSERIPVLQRGLDVDTSVLEDLLKLKQKPRLFSFNHRLSSEEVMTFHSRVYRLLTHAVQWMESKRPM